MDYLSQDNFDKSPITFAPSLASAPQEPELQMQRGLFSLLNIAQLIFFGSTGYHRYILSATIKMRDSRITSSSVTHYIMNFIILPEAFALEVRPFPRRL